METGFLSVASLDDIVFEGRNKAYGAYVLRQEYPVQVLKAAAISMLSVFLFLIWLVAFGPEVPLPDDTRNSELKDHSHTLLPEPYIPASPPARAMEAEPAGVDPTVATRAFRQIKIVSDLTPVVNDIPSQSDFTQADPGLVTATGEIPGTAAPETTVNLGAGNGTETSQPFEVVEKMPEFPDGQSAMYKFINKHLRYPPEAQNQGLEGNVILTFVISATGEISEIKILQDIGGGAGEEAQRVVRMMPSWRPGFQHQRAVPVRFTLPIRFRMN